MALVRKGNAIVIPSSRDEGLLSQGVATAKWPNLKHSEICAIASDLVSLQKDLHSSVEHPYVTEAKSQGLARLQHRLNPSTVEAKTLLSGVK